MVYYLVVHLLVVSGTQVSPPFIFGGKNSNCTIISWRQFGYAEGYTALVHLMVLQSHLIIHQNEYAL